MALSSRDIFFRLLDAGIHGTIPSAFTATPEQWVEVHALANRQAVTGIVFDAVQKLPEGNGLPLNLAARWLVETQKIEARNEHIAKVIDAQKKAWDHNGIDAILMKGHSIAALYPIPEHRACGDIDWYFPSDEDWEKANAIARKNGLELKLDSDGDVHYMLANVIVEHHRDGRRQDCPIDVIVMLVEHVLHHAMVMGVGMKQVADVAAAYNYFEGKFDKEELSEALRKEGLLEWDGLLRKVISQVDEPDVRTLTELILADGNFGLDKIVRLSGFLKRWRLFRKYAPSQFYVRWMQLFKGRLKRCFTR